MITCYFGVPGAGKTTLLTKFAVKELKKIKRGKSRYKHVYTNFYCKGAETISFSDLNQFKIYDSLILFDELALDADNRSFKTFPQGIRDFFVLHRHLGNDIIYATQSYDNVDLKIRQLTQELWYMSKTVIPFFCNFTNAKRIYRTVNINEYKSELVLGYRFCNFLEGLFATNFKTCFRPFYYRYFDSFDECQLVGRPVYSSSFWGNNQQVEEPKNEDTSVLFEVE